MQKETIKPDGADKTLPQVIPPAIVGYACKLQPAVAREVRERAGCSGLFGLSCLFGCLVEPDQLDEPDRPEKPDKPDRPHRKYVEKVRPLANFHKKGW